METKTTVYALIAVVLVASVGYLYYERAGLLRTIQARGVEIASLLDQLGDSTEIIQIGMLVNNEKTRGEMRAVSWIAEDEINRYCDEIGSQFRFEFLLDSTEGQSAVALEKVQSFRAMGIDLVVAYLGSEYNAILSYINDNSMVFIDAVNTMPEFALPNDGLHRMRPRWALQGHALAENMWSMGMEAAIVLRQDLDFMDELYDIFTEQYEALGGVVFAEAYIPGPEETETSNFFVWLENQIQGASDQYGEDSVGVQVLAYSDFLSLFPYLDDHPAILDVIWFGNEALANHPSLFMYNPVTADRIKILSPSPTVEVDGDMYQTFASAYSSAYYRSPSFEACLIYDSCWAMAKSVIAAGTPEGEEVTPMVIPTSNDHRGTTGWCTLDANGDRTMMDYDVWGYSLEPGGFTAVKYGYYEGATDATTWLTSPTFTSCAESGYHGLFVANFDGDSAGSPPAPTAPLQYGPPGAALEAVGDADAVLVVDSSVLGSKAMRMRRSYGSETSVEARVGDIGDMPYSSGVAYVEYRAHCEEYSAVFISGMSISVRSEGGQAALVMRFYDGLYHILEGETYIPIVGSYDPSAEHTVHIKLDLDARRYWICIGGEEVLSDRPFASEGFTELHSLDFFVAHAVLEAFPMVYVVDDIRITK